MKERGRLISGTDCRDTLIKTIDNRRCSLFNRDISEAAYIDMELYRGRMEVAFNHKKSEVEL